MSLGGGVSGGRELVVATGNAHKVAEIGAILGGVLGSLGVRLVGLRDVPGGLSIPEPVEDAGTFEGNALIKARAYASATGRACLADDSGLEVSALGGEPGVESAYYAGSSGSRGERDARNNAKLLGALAGVAEADRGARYVCVMVVCGADGSEVARSRGEMAGRIGTACRGEGGFGYDPLMVLGDGRSAAELTPEEKSAVSHRGVAARSLAEALRRVGFAGDT